MVGSRSFKFPEENADFSAFAESIEAKEVASDMGIEIIDNVHMLTDEMFMEKLDNVFELPKRRSLSYLAR